MPSTWSMPALAAAGAVATAAVLAAPTSAQERVLLPENEVVLAGQPIDVFSIGALDGQSWEMFGSVDAVAFGANDDLYVLDARNYRVLVYDAQGRFVRQIGEQGNGPGEIGFPVGMFLDGQDRVVIADLAQNGWSVFTAAGEHVGTFPFPDGMRPSIGRGVASDGANGAILMSLPTLRGGDGVAIRSGAANLTLVRQPLAAAAKPVTLATIAQPEPKIEQSGNASNQRVMVMMRPPAFAPQVSWGALPGGWVAVTSDAEYAVRLIDSSGRVIRTIARDVKPRAVTRRDQDAARERLREQLRNPSRGSGIRMTNENGRISYAWADGGPPADASRIEEQVRSMTFADVLPLVAQVRTDATGRIWILRTDETGGPDGPIDIVRADGSYIGTLRDQALPDAASASGLAAFIERDELDVPRVAVRRLPADWR